MMRPDSIAREPEVLGNDFVDHYGGTREHEVKLWNEAVTNWEGAFRHVRPDFYLNLDLCSGTLSGTCIINIPCSNIGRWPSV